MTDIIPICKYCNVPLLRWGWYFEESEPVMYWYAFCCDLASSEHYGAANLPEPALGPFIIVLPRGTLRG
jgi:hypothetical protein